MRPKNSPRYVRINIIKVVDFYTENYKFSNILPKFLKEITKVLHNWKYILCSFIRRQCFYSNKKTLECPTDSKEIKSVHPKGNKPWIFIGRTEAEGEVPVLRPPDAKSWLIGKDRDAGKDWRREKGTTKDAMAGWHHRLDGHELESSPRVGDGQGGLACRARSRRSRRVGHGWATELNCAEKGELGRGKAEVILSQEKSLRKAEEERDRHVGTNNGPPGVKPAGLGG